MPVHPMTVHFPIAFLMLTSVVVVWTWWSHGTQPALKTWSWYLLLLTIGSILIAVITGRNESIGSNPADALADAYQRHEIIGYAVLWALGLMAFWMYLRADRWNRGEHFIFCLMLILLSVLISLGAHAGAEMVYLHGVGVHGL